MSGSASTLGRSAQETAPTVTKTKTDAPSESGINQGSEAVISGMALKRPCRDCPFRTDSPRFLTDSRYGQIAKALLDQGESFTCHKTLESDRESGELAIGASSRHCAGAMIWLQAQSRPNTIMQIMERLGAWSPERLDMEAPVYRTRRGFECGEE